MCFHFEYKSAKHHPLFTLLHLTQPLPSPPFGKEKKNFLTYVKGSASVNTIQQHGVVSSINWLDCHHRPLHLSKSQVIKKKKTIPLLSWSSHPSVLCFVSPLRSDPSVPLLGIPVERSFWIWIDLLSFAWKSVLEGDRKPIDKGPCRDQKLSVSHERNNLGNESGGSGRLAIKLEQQGSRRRKIFAGYRVKEDEYRAGFNVQRQDMMDMTKSQKESNKLFLFCSNGIHRYPFEGC